MSKTNCLFHIVICTKNRKATIPEDHKRELYAYIFGIIKAKNCKLFRMNGVANHVHMLIELHPTVALSTLVRDIKRSSSIWLSNNQNFPDFDGWAHEYFAFSKSFEDKQMVYNYILNQEQHHNLVSFDDEVQTFAIEECFEWKNSYFG